MMDSSSSLLDDTTEDIGRLDVDKGVDNLEQPVLPGRRSHGSKRPRRSSSPKSWATRTLCAWFIAIVLVVLQFLNLNASLKVYQSTAFVKRLLLDSGALMGYSTALQLQMLQEETNASTTTKNTNNNLLQLGEEETNTTTTRQNNLLQVEQDPMEPTPQEDLAVSVQPEDPAQINTLTPTQPPEETSHSINNNNDHNSNPYWNGLLQVPFYIYTDATLDWSNATRRRGLTRKWERLDQSNYIHYKHSDDYWFLQAAKRHPLRVSDPAQAKLFFVPTLINAWNFHDSLHVRDNHQKQTKKTTTTDDSSSLFCVEDKCDDALLQAADDTLKASPWFQRHQGRDHIVVDSHFLKRAWWRIRRPVLFSKVHQIQFEHKLSKHFSEDRIAIPSMYVGRACPPVAAKTHDFCFVARFKPEKPEFLSRQQVCQWLQDDATTQYKVSRCGMGDQCPALAQAKYGFHIRGDSWGANRLMDTLLSRTVPLFTNTTAQLAILPDFVPWLELGYAVDITTQTAMDASLAALLAKPAEEYQQKLQRIQQYMPYLDHTQPGQLDVYMATFAVKLGLQAPLTAQQLTPPLPHQQQQLSKLR